MLSTRRRSALDAELVGVDHVMALFDGTQSVACHCGWSKAREQPHPRSTEHVVSEQRIGIQDGQSIARYMGGSSRMVHNLTEYRADRIRFLAKAPKFLRTEDPYSTPDGTERVVGAGKDRIGSVHNR